MQTDVRLDAIHDWLRGALAYSDYTLRPASADASFRRYFRLEGRAPDRPEAGTVTRIVMDAPPDKEDIGPYLRVTRLLSGCGVHVPEVHAVDERRGLVLLEDLGHTHYLTRLEAGADPDPLYAAALESLLRIQVRGQEAARELAPYDAPVLQREMALMPEWFLGRHLAIEPTAAERAMLEAAFAFLTREALAQPTVFVHRDYHSRNLMVLESGGPGIIDFQDALRGPVGYDLVSLLKDCYVAWPRARVEGWLRGFRDRLLGEGAVGAALAGRDFAEFLRWFDLVGLQRHVKVLGIFARLNWRDGKPGYLADLPRTLDYAREVAAMVPELRDFSAFLEERVAPALPAANSRARQAS
jgi:aminoglycoside/choline kinase family phosphotransferase